MRLEPRKQKNRKQKKKTGANVWCTMHTRIRQGHWNPGLIRSWPAACRTWPKLSTGREAGWGWARGPHLRGECWL